VLNALRHHRYFHTIYRWATTQNSSAQRLAASQVLSPNRRPCSFVESRVLNALRHHRYFHFFSGVSLPGMNLCSTPCGITGTFTIVIVVILSARKGAQRLAASQVLSHARTR